MRIIRAGEHIQHIPGYGITVRESGVAVAAANWWEVSGKTCVAAWQPKGAASYAASKVNLTGNTDYDAVEGSAPGWDDTNGWKFTSTAHYLRTGITTEVTEDWTVLFRFSDVSTGDYAVFGRRGDAAPDSPRFYISLYYSGDYVQYNFGYKKFGDRSPRVTSGVLGLAAGQPYRNGSADGEAISVVWGTVTDVNMAIGGLTLETGVRAGNFLGYIQAMAFWSDTLTAGEVATVSAAMAAL